MEWRRLRANEIDHELLWLFVSLATGALAVAWLKAGLPLPDCTLHRLTGIPCPGCGATRCLRDFAAGHFHAAFAWNPLFFCVLVWTLLFDMYAATVLALGFPRLRIAGVSGSVAFAVRTGVVALLLANWIYLIAAGR